jgi:hypothetical protein
MPGPEENVKTLYRLKFIQNRYVTLKIMVSYAIRLQLNYDDAKRLPMVTKPIAE